MQVSLRGWGSLVSLLEGPWKMAHGEKVPPQVLVRFWVGGPWKEVDSEIGLRRPVQFDSCWTGRRITGTIPMMCILHWEAQFTARLVLGQDLAPVRLVSSLTSVFPVLPQKTLIPFYHRGKDGQLSLSPTVVHWPSLLWHILKIFPLTDFMLFFFQCNKEPRHLKMWLPVGKGMSKSSFHSSYFTPLLCQRKWGSTICSRFCSWLVAEMFLEPRVENLSIDTGTFPWQWRLLVQNLRV